MIEQKVDLSRFDDDVNELYLRKEPKGAIVFYGSSTFTYWGHGPLAKDMYPLTVVNRGFGGSTAHDALHHYDKLIKPIAPKTLVLYEGDNDIELGYTVHEIMEITSHLFDKMRADFKDICFVILTVKKSITRENLWSKMDDLNGLYSQYAENNKDTTLVDMNIVALDDNGNPRKGIYIEDGLHFNKEGYVLLCDQIKPVLLGI